MKTQNTFEAKQVFVLDRLYWASDKAAEWTIGKIK